MRIGILQTGHAPDEVQQDHGDFAAMFARLLNGNGFEFSTFNVVDMEFPETVAQMDGWLITGSKFGVYDDAPFIAPLAQFVRDAHAAKIPMVGICFGHQIMARALGAPVEKFDGGWAIGRNEYAGELGDIALNAWHQDQVLAVPEGAEVILKSDFCKIAGLRYGDWGWSIQPHPEFSCQVMADYATIRMDDPAYPQGALQAALDKTDQPIMDHLVATEISQFFKGAHLAHGGGS